MIQTLVADDNDETLLAIIDLRDEDTSASGAIYPILTLWATVRTPTEGMSIEIERSRTTVSARCARTREVLGIGLSDIGGDVFDSSGSDYSIDIPITHQALAYATEHCMEEEQVILNIDMDAVVDVQKSPDSDWQQVTASLRDEDRSSKIDPSIWVPRSSWFYRVLSDIRMEDYIFLEIPVPKSANKDRWAKARKHLEQAERLFRNGNDAQVLAVCYSALESLHHDPKQIFAPMADSEKRKHVEALMVDTKRYLHSGRHVVRSDDRTEVLGDFDVDHRDASFALAVTKCWIAYATTLLYSP